MTGYRGSQKAKLGIWRSCTGRGLKGVRSVNRFARARSSLILEHKTADQIRSENPAVR